MPGALHAEVTPDGRTLVLLPIGDDWSRSQITTRLSKVTPTGTIDPRTGAVTMACTWPAVIQLGQSFPRSAELHFVMGENLQAWYASEHVRRTSIPPELEKSWPDGLEPRPYQVEAARMIGWIGKVLLLDDMGLGKTLSTILGVEQRRRLGHAIFPLVILVPSRVVGRGWAREIRKWMPSWPKPVMYWDSGRVHGAVTITTYATARLDAADRNGPLARLGSPAVIIDEASLIQNTDAKQSQAAERITRQAHTVVECSGTLITYDVLGAFAPLKVMDKLSWADKHRYKDRFCESRKTDHAEVITGLNPHTEAEFRACLAGQMVRRAKADVLKDLPPKVYSVLDPDIPPEWRAAYRQMEQDMIAELPDGGELNAFDTLAKWRRLSQLASSAADVEWTEETDTETGEVIKTQKVTLRAPSWKAEVLMELMKVRTAPVVVFTESRQLAVITGEDYLRPAGLRFGYIIGKGAGVTDRTREQARADFAAGKLDAVICTSGSGGVGVDGLQQAADTVVMLQRSPKLDDAIQPEDRVHRMGQKAAAVNIIDVVARGTVEMRTRELLRGKAGQWAQLARDPRIVKELLGGNQ